MQAVILADRLERELAPVASDTGVAMLNVIDKPLLQHTLEGCVAAGIKEAYIVVSRFPDLIKSYFSGGELWNINIHYCYSRGEEHPDEILKRFKSSLKLPFLLVRGDVYRHTSKFSAQLKGHPETIAKPTEQFDACRGLVVVQNWSDNKGRAAWPLNENNETRNATKCALEPSEEFSPLENLRDYYETNLAALHASENRINAVGLNSNRRVLPGALVKIHNDTEIEGAHAIGSNSEIKRGVALTGRNLIGSDCIIDENARISDSIVMPGTYVGKNLSVQNSIVCKNRLIRLDTETSVEIFDPVLVGDTSDPAKHILGSTVERAVAMWLLVLSIPLWGLVVTAGIFSSEKGLTELIRIRSNRRKGTLSDYDNHIVCALLSSRIPVLRELPLLFQVLRGRLSLFGLPAGEGESLRGISQSESENKFGLYGPRQLHLPENPSELELQLAHQEFISRTGFGVFTQRLIALARYLGSAKAWRAQESAA